MRMTVNGVSIEVPDGSSVSVKNGEVVVSGESRFTYAESVRVEVAGSCGSVQTVSGDVTVTGSVGGSIQTVSGDVQCGAVAGSVRTVSGDVYRG